MPRPPPHTQTAPAGAVVVITHAETVKESQEEGGDYMFYMANASQTNGRRFVRATLCIVDDSPPYISPPLLLYPQDTIVWRA